MAFRIDVVEENGLVLARVPCAMACSLNQRLIACGVQPTYSIRDDQLLIYFRNEDRATAQGLMDLAMVDPSAPDEVETSHEHVAWTRQLLVGRHL